MSRGAPPLQLCGLLIHLECYVSQHNISKVGMTLFKEEKVQDEVTVNEAIWLKERLGLSKAQHQELRLCLLSRLILPSEYKIQEELRKLRPKLHHGAVDLDNPEAKGVKANLTDCLEFTLLDILTTVESKSLLPTINELDVLVSFKWGMDGSGGHLELGPSTASRIISVCFVVTKIFLEDKTVLWTPSEHWGANSPRNIHPWAFIPANAERCWKS